MGTDRQGLRSHAHHWHGGELIHALVVTRLIFDFLLPKNWLKKLPMLHAIRVTKLNFHAVLEIRLSHFVCPHRRRSGYGGFGRGNKMLGIDFAGGTI